MIVSYRIRIRNCDLLITIVQFYNFRFRFVLFFASRVKIGCVEAFRVVFRLKSMFSRPDDVKSSDLLHIYV